MGVKVREKDPGSGEWWVYVYHGRKRTAKKVGDKTTANRLAKLMEAQIRLGQFPSPKTDTPTLNEFYKRFQRVYMKSAIRESTRISYETNFRCHILPELGKYRLNEIDRDQLEQFVSKLVSKKVASHRKHREDQAPDKDRKTLSKNSIRLILASLSVVLNWAREKGLMDSNPATGLARFYRQAPTRNEEIEPLTPGEVRRFLQAVLKHSSKYYALFLCAIHTGLRSGELLALQWGDIDWKGMFWTVRRSYVRGQIVGTKTSRIRRVDLSDAALKALAELRKVRQEQWLEKGVNEIPQWLFCNEQGELLDESSLKRRHFKKCLKKAGLREIRFHDLRHTFASLLIQNGESLAYVKDQLGHASIKMTVDVYGHLVPGANRQAVNRLPSLDPDVKEEQEQVEG